MYVDLGTGVRRSKDVPRITYVLKSALLPDLLIGLTPERNVDYFFCM